MGLKELKFNEGEEIKLIVDNPEVAEAVVPVRWCVKPSVLEQLRDREIQNPYLLLVSVRLSKHDAILSEERRVISLAQSMDYVQFNAPGKWRIYAILLENEAKDYTVKKNIKDIFLDVRRDRSWRHLLFGWDLGLRWRTIATGSVNVNVGPEFFALEPAQWEKSWVNMFFEGEARDQCHFRRRKFFAYTLQGPIMLLLASIIAVCVWLPKCLWAILLWLHGYRVNFSLLFRSPLYYGFADLWKENKNRTYYASCFLTKKDGSPRPWGIIFMPVILGSFIGIVLLIAKLSYLSFLAVFVMVTVALVKASAIIGVFLLVIWILNKISPSFYEKSVKEKYEKEYELTLRKKQQKTLAFDRIYQQLKLDLWCNMKIRPELKDLPKHRRTIYLRFQEFKAKVCKPFARG